MIIIMMIVIAIIISRSPQKKTINTPKTSQAHSPGPEALNLNALSRCRNS